MFTAAYVGAELPGGEALGWVVGGAMVVATCFPLFRRLFEMRASR